MAKKYTADSIEATSFTGSLAGTASYATQALSASWAPATGITSASYISGAITNNVDNYLLTATGTGNINGESTLTYNGSTLTVAGRLSQGSSNTATGPFTHAQGSSTNAVGTSSHAEGDGTFAIGNYSHTEGYETKTGTKNAYYAEKVESGIITLNSPYGDVSSQFIVDNYLYLYDLPFQDNYSYDIFPISQSYFNAPNTFIELYDTSISTAEAYVGDVNYGVNNWTGDQIIPGNYSHTEGNTTIAIGHYSHTEGKGTQAVGLSSHAEGADTKAIGEASHTEGNNTQAIGYASHAEGINTKAIGRASHAEGINTISSGRYSHAEGVNTYAEGYASHAEGIGTVSAGNYQHVQGQYNITSSADSVFIIGNGTGTGNRSNLVYASGSTFQVTGSLNVTGSLTIKGAPSYIYMNDNAGGLWRVSITTGGTFQIESIA